MNCSINGTLHGELCKSALCHSGFSSGGPARFRDASPLFLSLSLSLPLCSSHPLDTQFLPLFSSQLHTLLESLDVGDDVVRVFERCKSVICLPFLSRAADPSYTSSDALIVASPSTRFVHMPLSLSLSQLSAALVSWRAKLPSSSTSSLQDVHTERASVFLEPLLSLQFHDVRPYPCAREICFVGSLDFAGHERAAW